MLNYLKNLNADRNVRCFICDLSLFLATRISLYFFIFFLSTLAPGCWLDFCLFRPFALRIVLPVIFYGRSVTKGHIHTHTKIKPPVVLSAWYHHLRCPSFTLFFSVVSFAFRFRFGSVLARLTSVYYVDSLKKTVYNYCFSAHKTNCLLIHNIIITCKTCH